MKDEAYRLMAELDETYWWFQARREIVCDVVARFVPPGGAILDYGGGTGALAARLCGQGYRVVAADVSRPMLASCRERGIPTIDLDAETIPPASADCVLACDVLEHVEDDVGLLNEFRAALRPGGLFLGTVPAYEFLWSGEDHVSSHFRRYTRRSLVRTLESAGYEVAWVSYFNTLLFPLAASVILAKRLFRPRDMYRSNVVPLPGWQNAACRAVFARERILLRWLRFPVGLSLIVAARPREPSGAQRCTRPEPSPPSSASTSRRPTRL
jgi:SAM-dependent methyltransferase